MWSLCTILILGSHFMSVLSEDAEKDLGKVVFVSMIYRHGDRVPIRTYPNDPYKNNSLWPVPWGDLTDVGKRRQYKLGKWLRGRYSGLLPKKYNKSDIYVRSTDVDRTLMSAYCNLAGLYEPNRNTNWNPEILWTPIPVHTIPVHLDNVLAGGARCPKYDEEEKQVLDSAEFKELNEKYKDLYKYLTENSGMNVTNVMGVEMIYDILFIEEQNNFQLPNWTKSVYPQPMRDISALIFSIPCYTKAMARLKIGLLLGDILNNMVQKAAGNKTEKVWVYSAHDVTVANVLKALDVFELHCPPYASLILFELREKDKEHFVTMYYRNSSSIPPYFIQLPGCDKLCPLEKFQKIVTPLIPDNWSEECKKINFVENMFDTTASISFVTAMSFAILFLVSLVALLRFYRSQRWSQSEFAYKILKTEVAS